MKKILRRRFLSFLLLLSFVLQGPAVVRQNAPFAVAAESRRPHAELVAEQERLLSALDQEYREKKLSLAKPENMERYTQRRQNIIADCKKGDTRAADFAGLVAKPNKDGSYDLRKEYISSGSEPKSVASDMDISALKNGGAKKLAERMNASGKGYNFVKDPHNSHRYIDEARNVVIWEKPPDLKVGSSKWKAWVSSSGTARDTFSSAGGLFKTTDKKMGVEDALGAVLDNCKKAAEAGISNKNTGLSDGKTIAKSVVKASEWSHTGIDPNFKKQCETLQQGGSWEQARVTDFTDTPEVRNDKIAAFKKKASEALLSSAQNAKRHNAIQMDRRRETLRRLERKPRSEWKSQDRDLWNKTKAEIIMINGTNRATLKGIAKSSSEMGASLTGRKIEITADGRVKDLKTGKIMNKERFARITVKTSDIGKLKKPLPADPVFVRQLPVPAKSAPVSKFSPRKALGSAGKYLKARGAGAVNWARAKVTGGMTYVRSLSPKERWLAAGKGTMKVAGLVGRIYGVYNGVMAYKRHLDQAAVRDPENFGMLTVGEGLALGVGTFLGIQGAIDTAYEHYAQDLDEYYRDQARGRKWNLTPEQWVGVYLAWEGAKIIPVAGDVLTTGEALYVGGSALKAYHAAWNAAGQAQQTENDLREKYRPLSELIAKAIGAPLPPVWERNRFKYWQIFRPILENPNVMAAMTKGMSAGDLRNWLKKYKEQRAKELGITFGTPGADNPDDNENIGAAHLALPAQARALWLRALEQGDAFVAEWLKKRDRGVWGDDVSPETLGAILDAALDSAPMELAAEMPDEQKEALEELCRDAAWNVALTPDVAILSSGYARGAAALMGNAEAAVMVRPDAQPELLANYRLLIVPSGALSDYAGSARFRGAIDRYLEAGGTVLAFAQQLGREYEAIPGGVAAYGFAEDQSCQYASARIMTNNGAFASMTKGTPDFNVDGYFLDWPRNGEVWLSRTKNDQPCMIAYPWKNGRVVLSTLYLDWAAGNHQSTADEKLFFRDLVAFLLDGEDVPFVAKGSAVKICAAAEAPKDGATVTPPEDVVWQSFAPLVIAPDGIQLEAKPDAGGWIVPAASQSGFYRLGADFLDEAGQVVAQAAPQTAFVVSVLPEDAAVPPAERLPFSLSLASDLENYVRGAQGRFTARFWERSGRPQELRAEWKFVHNGWAASAENKKLYAGSDQVRLPANGEFVLEKTITIINTDSVDRFYVDVFDAQSGAKLAAMSKGFYTHAPRTSVTVTLDRTVCEPGGALAAEMSCENPFKVPCAGTARFAVLDGAGRSVLTEEKAFDAGAESAAAAASLKLPDGMSSGPCSVQVYVVLKGTMTGAGRASFNYLGSPQEFRGVLTDRITKKPIPKGTVSFHLGKARFEAESGEDGTFALQIPAGKFAFQAGAPEYNDFGGDVLLAPERQPLNVELLPAGSGLGVGTARGRVIDRVTGEPLPGMELELRGGSESYRLRSDAAGSWSAALLPGDYEARCLIDAASPDSNRFAVRSVEGLELKQDLYPAVGKLRFKVFDAATGQPAENVQALVNTESGWTRDVSASLNRERAERLLPGRGKIRLTAAGYETLETEFWAGERVSDFTAYLRPVTCRATFAVLDWITEKPVAGARVTLDGETAPLGTTGAEGLAVVRGVNVGRRRINVEAAGYRALKTEGFFAAASAEPAARRLYLTPDRDAAPGAARFVVRNLISDEPLEGVAISWEKAASVTKADGAAEMPLPDGRRRLSFACDGFRTLETECLMNAVNAEAETYWLEPLQTVRTLVLRHIVTGAPLADVKVSLNDAILGSTAKDGTLAVTVPRGRLRFVFEHKDFEPLKTELFLNACAQERSLREEIFLKPKLGAFAYAAMVRDPDGAPLKSVEVTLRAGDKEHRTKTDAKGLFAFKLPPGVFDLKLSLSDYRVLETRGYSGGGSRKGVVEDYVLYPLNRPVPEENGKIVFEVTDAVSGKTIDLLQAEIDGRSLICDSGTLTCEARPGSRNVFFRAEGYEDLGSYRTAFFPGQTVTRRVHLWPTRGEVEFRVCDAVTGEPLRNFAGRTLDGEEASFDDGVAAGRAFAGNRRTNFWAEGYLGTDNFYPTAFPGRRVTRSVALFPSAGTVEFKVRDVLTGEALKHFVGRTLDGGSAPFAGGAAVGRASPGNRRTNFWAEGYAETGDFYPTAFPGRAAVRSVALFPRVGTVEFRVSDAVAGKPLEKFAGHALEGEDATFTDGVAVRRASPGNRRTNFWCEGYFGTDNFYPTAFPGRTVICPVELWPSSGTAEFRLLDALSGEPLKLFASSPLDLGNRAFAGSAAVSAAAWRNLRTWFAAPGYRSVSDYWPAAYGGRSVRSAVFMMPEAPVGQLTLRAFDVVTGRPVRGATFRADGRDVAAPAGEAIYRSAADFKRMNVRAWAPGYHESSMPAFLTAGHRDLSAAVPMMPVMPKGKGKLLVTVTDGEGTALQGAVVTLPAEKSAVKAVTNEAGRAFFTNVPAGVPSLSVSREGFASASIRAGIAGGRTFAATVALRPLSELKAPRLFDPVITAVPEGEILRPGDRKALKFTVENRGDVGGSAFCSVAIPDVHSGGVDLALAPGESREAVLSVAVPDDAVTSRILVTARAEQAERNFMVEIRSPVFELTARSDKAAYAEGGVMSVTLTAAAEEGTPDGDYQFRVTWNGRTWTQDARLTEGKTEATFEGIPVTFAGNKLLFALYHADGRSVVIDALPVLNDADEILMIPGKSRYRAGETAKITIRSASEKELTLRSPLFGGTSLKTEEKLVVLSEESDGTEFEFQIPEPILTGAYEIQCGEFSVPVGVRGFETKILDRRLDESGGDEETALLTLSWRAATRGEIPCRWTLTARNPLDGEEAEPREIASGDLILAGEWAEYSVPAAVPAAEPRDLELKLVPRGLETPAAVLRYVWDGRN